MNSELTDAPRADHPRIEKAVMSCARSSEAAGPARRIGVFNESGTVYWKVVTRGDHEFTRVVQEMSRLGFRDELREARRRPVGGYDALFVAAPRAEG